MRQVYVARAIAVVLAFTLWAPITSEAGPQFTRALPLNHLPGRPPGESRAGFHYMRTAIGDDYFDGTSPLSRVQRHLAIAHQAGVKYLRCAFSWNAIEKAQGEYDWTFWDALVRLASESGIEVLPYVAYTPRWAARNPNDFWRQPPRDARLYADFMHTISARYRGRIHSWEIWNEPDNKDYWTGSADQFASLAILAARRIREADPAAVLILGGMAHGPGQFFRSLIRSYHIDQYVDVVAMHAYPETWLEERAESVFEQWIPAMRQMIANDNSGADLWVNEMGYADYRFQPSEASIYGINVFYRYEHTPEYQAAMQFKFETMALAAQIDLAGWYRIDDFPITEKRLGSDLVNYHLGVVRTNGSPKPVLAALRLFNQLLGQPVRVFHEASMAGANSQLELKTFQRKDGEIIVVAWLRSSNKQEVTASAPPGQNISASSLGQKLGMLQDGRSETVSVSLPCTDAKVVSEEDPEGQRSASPARVNGDSLSNIRVRGGEVFIAELSCSGADND